MPHYRWLATDTQGAEYEGVLWAATPALLHDELAKQGLQIITAKQQPLKRWGARWRIGDALRFFEQLQQLLAVGLLLPQALAIMGRAGTMLRRALATELQQGLVHGCTLAVVMQQLPDFFDAVIVTLVGSGHNADTLAQVFEQVINLLRMRIMIRKQVWQALATPLLTLAFFIGVVIIIFVAIVPSFEGVVLMTGQRVPASLQRMFAISHWVCAYGLVGFIFGIVFFVMSGWLVVRSAWGKKICAWLGCFTPGVCRVYWDLQLSLIFHAIGVLVRSGHEVASAVTRVGALIGNPYIHKAVARFGDSIAHGMAPVHAYEQIFGKRAACEVSAMLEVGQQAGAMARMCEYAGQFYFERAQRWLKRFMFVLQPVLMVMLGFLIVALLYAVYTPLVQLPEMVNQTMV